MKEEIRIIGVERVDDIPVLLATLQRLRLAELLDRHFPKHHLWKGELSPGEVICVWLTFLLSQSDHRLYKVQPWAQQHLLTLQACLGKPVRSLDLHDDRLADLLDALAQPDPYQAFEADLNIHTIRVYNLKPERFRIDTTTANSYAEVVDEDGLLQFGHSKGDSDRPQLKVAACALDPLGMPLTCLTVPGNSADDPLYSPQIDKVRHCFGSGGKTFIGDCKMASLATRADVVQSGDYYLCPLSEKQMSQQERLQQLQKVWQGQQQLQPVYRPCNKPGEKPELIAEGFCVDVLLQAEVRGQQVSWTERRWLVSSRAFAQGQQQQLHRRLSEATEQLQQLTQRKRGKKRLDEAELQAAAEEILGNKRVQGLLTVQVRTEQRKRQVRGYVGKPARVEVETEYQLEVTRDEQAIDQAVRQMGWQVYAINQLELPLPAVVLAYRGQYSIEGGWSRLKGKPLSLQPMYLQDEERIQGLVLLLMLAVRVLTLLEWQVREKLQQQGDKLKGIYPGQPGRQTSRPSAEMLLFAFKEISLTVIEVAAEASVHITDLTPLQEKLLVLWDLPPDLFHRLTLDCPQPPPALGER